VVVTRRKAAIEGAIDVIEVQPGSDGLGWFLAVPEVRRIAKEVAPSLVHGHYVTSYGFWAAVCGVKPVVLTAWGSDILVTPKQSFFMRCLVRWTLRQAKLITADSQDMLGEIKKYRVPGALHEILWGADTNLFAPAPQRPPGFKVVSLRSWEANYNIDILLRAFADFANFARVKSKEEARLLLLGGGPQEAPLKQLAADLNIEPQVEFRGRVDDTGMVIALQESHVSVSIPTSDATSVSLLESLACGLPVIVSDLPANRQWVRSQENGWIVPVGDVFALTQALIKLHDDHEAVSRIGLNNRQLALARASRQVQMDRMSRLYSMIIG
jgi:glycosyltransferase involved in cell wall biosynthesis